MLIFTVILAVVCKCYRRRREGREGQGTSLLNSFKDKKPVFYGKQDRLTQPWDNSSISSANPTGNQSGTAISEDSSEASKSQVRAQMREAELLTSALSSLEAARCFSSAIRTFHPQIAASADVFTPPILTSHWAGAQPRALPAPRRQPMGSKQTKSTEHDNEKQRPSFSRDSSSDVSLGSRRRSSIAPVLPAGLNARRKRAPSEELRRDSAEFWVPAEVLARTRAKSLANAFDMDVNGGLYNIIENKARKWACVECIAVKLFSKSVLTPF